MTFLKLTAAIICSIFFSFSALATPSIYGAWKTNMYYGSIKVTMKMFIQEDITYMSSICEQNGKVAMVSIEVPSKVVGNQYFVRADIKEEVNENGVYCTVKSLLSPLTFTVTDTILTLDAAILGKLTLERAN